MNKPLIDRIKEAEGIFKAHKERLQPEVDKGYQTYESEAISYEDGQNILSILVEAREFVEQASKPLSEQEGARELHIALEALKVKAVEKVMAMCGFEELQEANNRVVKLFMLLHAHAARLEGEWKRGDIPPDPDEYSETYNYAIYLLYFDSRLPLFVAYYNKNIDSKADWYDAVSGKKLSKKPIPRLYKRIYYPSTAIEDIAFKESEPK